MQNVWKYNRKPFLGILAWTWTDRQVIQDTLFSVLFFNLVENSCHDEKQFIQLLLQNAE